MNPPDDLDTGAPAGKQKHDSGAVSDRLINGATWDVVGDKDDMQELQQELVGEVNDLLPKGS